VITVCKIIFRFFHVLFCFHRIVSCHQRDVAVASNRKEMMMHFLLLELETVGNIRFEEGNSSEPWYHIYVYKICCINPGFMIINPGCRISDLHCFLLPLSGSRLVMIFCYLVFVCGIINLSTSLALRSIKLSGFITVPCGNAFRTKWSLCFADRSLHPSHSESVRC